MSDESGQTLIVTAGCIVLLLCFVALAVDVGSFYYTQRIVQAAADAAAIAGTSELNYSDVTAAARADAALNGETNGSSGATVTVNSPPLSGPNAGNSSYVEVIVAQTKPVFFMSVLNKYSAVTVNARAVATTSPSAGCVYALNSSGTGFSFNGSGAITVSKCDIIVDSSSSSAFSFNGSGSITALSIGVVGNYSENGSGSVTPTPVTGIASTPDPLAYLTPPSYSTSACVANPNVNGSGTTVLGPASSGGTICYNGLTINGSGKVTLNAGTYIINGAFTINGSGTVTLGAGMYIITGAYTINGSEAVSGTGITFYLAPPSGSYVDNGSGSRDFYAPTSGTWDGILFYQDRTDSQAMTINGSESSIIEGIFYAPDSNVTLNGSGASTLYANFVVGSLLFNGSGTLQSYAAVNSSTPLRASGLTE